MVSTIGCLAPRPQDNDNRLILIIDQLLEGLLGPKGLDSFEGILSASLPAGQRVLIFTETGGQNAFGDIQYRLLGELAPKEIEQPRPSTGVKTCPKCFGKVKALGHRGRHTGSSANQGK